MTQHARLGWLECLGPLNGARSSWRQFIDPIIGNDQGFCRYRRASEEPRTLFDAIGEDLGSSSQEIKEKAFWLLVATMPELGDILHERESRQRGWRSGGGKDQRSINEGLDVLTYLYKVFVTQNRYKGGNAKSLQAYMRKTAQAWKVDEYRKKEREVPLGETMVSEVMLDPSGSAEDEALKELARDESRSELEAWGFVNGEEMNLMEGVYVDNEPIVQLAYRLGISYAAARQRISRITARYRAKAVLLRDAVLTLALATVDWYEEKPGTKLSNVGWKERARRSIDPRELSKLLGLEDEHLLAFRLTRCLGHEAGHIYIIAVHPDTLPSMSNPDLLLSKAEEERELCSPARTLEYLRHYQEAGIIAACLFALAFKGAGDSFVAQYISIISPKSGLLSGLPELDRVVSDLHSRGCHAVLMSGIDAKAIVNRFDWLRRMTSTFPSPGLVTIRGNSIDVYSDSFG